MKISRSTVLLKLALMAAMLAGNANALVYSISKGEAVVGFPALTFSGAARAFINQGAATMTINGVIAANNFPNESF